VTEEQFYQELKTRIMLLARDCWLRGILPVVLMCKPADNPEGGIELLAPPDMTEDMVKACMAETFEMLIFNQKWDKPDDKPPKPGIHAN